LTPARRRLHRLAARLGKSVEEVEQFTAREVLEWDSLDRPAQVVKPTSILDLFKAAKR
jgi:hypothetical protein